MLFQRSLQLAARRRMYSLAAKVAKLTATVAAQRTSSVVTRYASPLAVATNQQFTQRRGIETASQEAGTEILAKQRRARPVAPHLSIYKPQITWYPSMFNRITGVALSGIFYIYGIGYLVAPAMGWHFESAVLAASFAAWPIAAKVATKTLLALPFTFHSLNGVRHLVWDMGLAFKNKTVAQTGWSVVGLSVASALYLALAW